MIYTSYNTYIKLICKGFLLNIHIRVELHHTACGYPHLLARAWVAAHTLGNVNGRKYAEARDNNLLVFAKFLLCKVEKGVENTLHITLRHGCLLRYCAD